MPAQMVLLDSDFAKIANQIRSPRDGPGSVNKHRTISQSVFGQEHLLTALVHLYADLCIQLPARSFPHHADQSVYDWDAFIPAGVGNQSSAHSCKFLPNVMRRALPGGITDMFTVGVIVVCGALFGLSRQDISTASTMILAAVGFMVLYQICHPLNKFRSVIFYGCIMGLLVCASLFGSLFGIDTSRQSPWVLPLSSL